MLAPMEPERRKRLFFRIRVAVLLFVLFVVVVASVFGFDMMRTWWETNQWKRDARRRRKEMR